MSDTPQWTLRTTKRFDKEFLQLDPSVRRRVAAELDSILGLPNPRARGKALTGSLRGTWRYRIGDYRVLVNINENELCILALTVGHRGQVYR